MAVTEVVSGGGRPLRLSFGSAMLLMFTAFSVIPLLCVLIYSYQQNERSALSNLELQIGRNMDEAVRASAALVDTVGQDIAIVAAAAGAHPDYFRSDSSNDLLWRALTAADQTDAVYTSFDDGYHRVVSRIDDDRRRHDPNIPQDANWHASYIDSFSAGAARARHRSFFSAWGIQTGKGYDFPTDMNVSLNAQYAEAKRTGAMAVAEPSINPDTDSPIMSLGFPILAEGRFIGVVSANMTLTNISAYLQTNRVSPNSVSVIYDRSGNVIASSDAGLMPARSGNTVEMGKVGSIQNAAMAEAMKRGNAPDAKPFIFTSSSGLQSVVATRSFPKSFQKDWNILTVSPIDDFVGGLRATNQQVASVIAVVIVLELLLVFLVSRRISHRVGDAVAEFEAIGRFNLGTHEPARSIVKEINNLSTSLEHMKASLRSFGRYVPTDLVRKLLASGQDAEIGGERRAMTVMFSDIAGFTSISEKLSPEQLVAELGDYFGLMREGLREHHGTLDKYMGDGIMSFFNAPEPIEDHEIHACLAALQSQELLTADRAKRAADGRPIFSARIGLAVGEVIVGNIGTPDRFSYTVIGDTVNLASRLEGICKFYGVAITASGEVREATKDAFEWRHLDRVAVVGRTSGTDIYELLCRKGELSPDMASARDAYEAALDDYLAGKFSKAATGFHRLEKDHPARIAERMMYRRANKLARHPPEEEWAGVYAHTKK